LRDISYIVLHCAATPSSMDLDIETVRKWHLDKGWSDVGYHFFIKRDGTIQRGRDISVNGAHVRGYNSKSVGICYAGGVDGDGEPEDNRTRAQIKSMVVLCNYLKALKGFEDATVLGHCDFPDVKKACPSFDVQDFVTNYLDV